MSAPPIVVDDGWDAVVGQDAAVARLRASAADPVHSYLLVGPHGAGKRAAARALAATLLSSEASSDADRERHVRLALAEKHPDLVVVQATTAIGRLKIGGDASEENSIRWIRHQAALSPVESPFKVFVLPNMHLVDEVGPALLKAVEEPPPTTVFVMLAEDLVPELVTLASRSSVVRFGPVAEDVLVARLVAEGAAGDVATRAAAAAGGDLDRARLLVTDDGLAERFRTWAAVPGELDGTGFRVAGLVDELRGQIDASQAPLDALHAEQTAELEAEIERYQMEPRRAKAARDELKKQQNRDVRRHRAGELRFGLAVLARTHGDALAGADDRQAADVVAAVGRIQRVAEAIVRNPNEALLLHGLFVRLPRA